MPFTETPRMFDTVAGELIYTLGGLDSAGFTDASIVDERSGSTLALKRFYRTNSATINAAPAARSLIRFSPLQEVTGIWPAVGRTARIVVEAGGERSNSRLFTAGNAMPQLPSVPTTLPVRRTIARGEYDELTLFVPNDCFIELTRRFSDGETFWEAFQLLSVTRTEPGIFVIHADEYEPQTVGLAIDIRSGDERLGTFLYDFVSRPAGSRRVAWRSSLGSIEHFTFPAEKELVQTVRRGEGSGQTECSRTLTLLSGYQPRAVVAALAEIVGSPDVWVVADTGYVRVSPEGGSHGLRNCSGPTQLEIRLRIPESCAL